MAVTVILRSHTDTSGSGGLAIGLHAVDLEDLADYEAFILSGDITFALPINQFPGLNSELNAQIYNLYQAILDGVGSSSGIRPLADFYADATTAGNTDYEDFYNYTVAAGLLANDGDKISVEYGGTFAANGNTKTLRFTAFGTSVLSESFTDNAVDWEMECTIIRESNTVVRAYGNITVDGGSLRVNFSRITGLDLAANPYDILLRGRTLTAAGDVTARVGYILLIPAASVTTTYLTGESGDRLTDETGADYLIPES